MRRGRTFSCHEPRENLPVSVGHDTLILAPANDRPAATVYYDGSCPLCRLEISYYRACDGLHAIRFVDVSRDGADPGPNLERDTAMRRFHVRQGNGELVSGAAAFVAVWRVLPRWRLAARVAGMPWMMSALEMSYLGYLKIRPLISGTLRKAGL